MEAVLEPAGGDGLAPNEKRPLFLGGAGASSTTVFVLDLKMAVTGAEARKDGRDGRALLVEAGVEAENERFWVRTDCIVTNRGELRVFIWERMKESGAIGELVAKKKMCGVWSFFFQTDGCLVALNTFTSTYPLTWLYNQYLVYSNTRRLRTVLSV